MRDQAVKVEEVLQTFSQICMAAITSNANVSFISLTWVKACNSILKIEHWSHACLATLTKWLIYMQRAQCVILFLLLVVNSARFRILRSYTLLIKLPFLYALVAQHASLKVYRVGKILVNKFALSKRSYGHLISVNIYYYHASFAIQIYISFNKKMVIESQQQIGSQAVV